MPRPEHGLAGLTTTIALEAAPFGVTANAICPGHVRTPLVEKQIAETMQARGLNRKQVINEVLRHVQPTKRFVTVGEVAALALSLFANEARSMGGTVLPIDGGPPGRGAARRRRQAPGVSRRRGS